VRTVTFKWISNRYVRAVGTDHGGPYFESSTYGGVRYKQVLGFAHKNRLKVIRAKMDEYADTVDKCIPVGTADRHNQPNNALIVARGKTGWHMMIKLDSIDLVLEYTAELDCSVAELDSCLAKFRGSTGTRFFRSQFNSTTGTHGL
jgi:hypothetical protein